MVFVLMVGIEVFGWCKTEILRNLVFSGFPYLDVVLRVLMGFCFDLTLFLGF